MRDRGLIRLTGNRSGWAATITPDGQRRVDQEARRLREKAAREAAEAAEKERQAREATLAQQRAADLMDRILSTGRVDIAHDYTENELLRIEREAHRLGTLPDGEKLTHEHTRMDPDLGFTLYLRPDFEQRIPVRALKAPGRMAKTKHPAVARFLERRANVSKGSIPRAGRFLQGIVDGCEIVGWKVSDKVSRSFGGNDIHSATDLEFRIGSTTYEVAIRETDAQNRRRSPSPYVQEWDYYRGHTSKTVANKAFAPSGRLTVTVTTGWGATDLFRLSDEPGRHWKTNLPSSSASSSCASPRRSGNGKNGSVARRSAKNVAKRSVQPRSRRSGTNATPPKPSASSRTDRPRLGSATTPTRSTCEPANSTGRQQSLPGNGPSGCAPTPTTSTRSTATSTSSARFSQRPTSYSRT